jgi:hypothetical protein
LDPEAAKSPEPKKNRPLAEGRRGVRDAYTQVEGSRNASIVGGTVELTEVAHTDDRKMLEPSPDIEEGAHTRIPGDGRAVVAALGTKLPS